MTRDKISRRKNIDYKLRIGECVRFISTDWFDKSGTTSKFPDTDVIFCLRFFFFFLECKNWKTRDTSRAVYICIFVICQSENRAFWRALTWILMFIFRLILWDGEKREKKIYIYIHPEFKNIYRVYMRVRCAYVPTGCLVYARGDREISLMQSFARSRSALLNSNSCFPVRAGCNTSLAGTITVGNSRGPKFASRAVAR